METINHEYYISLEIAKLLKEAGFDWKVKKFYWYDKQREKYFFTTISMNEQPKSNEYLAPTIEVAQRWLREVRMHDVFVSPCNGLYFYTVRKYYHEGKVDYFDYPNKDAFDTYEKTLETGIKKALEMILKKGE